MKAQINDNGVSDDIICDRADHVLTCCFQLKCLLTSYDDNLGPKSIQNRINDCDSKLKLSSHKSKFFSLPDANSNHDFKFQALIKP